jgi:hypothetical protein
LHAEYKDFDKCHCSNQLKIQGLESEIKGLHSCIQELEVGIEELKALNDEDLKKLEKTKEVHGLGANMHDLEGQMEFERGQWIELHGKYKDLLDRFSILNHCKEISIAKVVRRILDDQIDKKFHERVLMEVTKRVIDIMGDTDIHEKLVSMDVDDQFNERVLREAWRSELQQERYHDMEEWLQ